MPSANRNRNRKTREQILKRRMPSLGYYIIVTDTKETEQNYMFGLKGSIPKELQGRLVIKVVKTKTRDLVDEALNQASVYPQYGEIWIVFDRDQVQDFDDIIAKALNRGIKVGWTNPCIEEWFHAYFGKMPSNQDSVACCDNFARAFRRIVNQKYEKSDVKIYEKLDHYGDETNAIQIAEQKLHEHEKNGVVKPSQKCPGTTVHRLVGEIKSKITRNEEEGT